MNKSEIISLIETGEGSNVEFKREEVHNDSLAKAIVAFSNTKGGNILIGVDDGGQVQGINQKDWIEKIVQICRNNIEPSVIPNINKITLSGKDIIHIELEIGKSKPYKVKTSNKFYIRVGNISIEPTTEELVRLFQEGEIYHFEVKPIPGVGKSELNLNLFYDYCENHRKFTNPEESEDSILKNLQFMDASENVTIAGILSFGKNPSRYLPQSGVALHCFAGLDASSQVLENRELNGTIPFLIDSALNFIVSHISVRSHVPENGDPRVDIYDYDRLICKEIIVNAFQHRDWSIFGQKIRIQIFSNRIEIFSPGKLPNTLNLQNALHGNSFYRNPLLSQLIRDYGYSDKMGRGLQKIIQKCKDMGYPQPEFKADLHSFTVILLKNPS